MRLESVSIGFIGSGRLGKALAWQFAAQGLRVAAVSGRRPAEAAKMAERIEGCQVLEPQQLVDRCELVFITTSDAAIRPAAEALRWRRGVSVVHCSGATEVGELAKAAREGASIGGFHPLQTFGDPQAAALSLAGCTITIEAEEPLDELLVGIAARLGCPVNRLPPGTRALYHAAAGYASQFINVMLHEAARMWTTWGGDEEAAVRAMLPMARGTLASIAQVGLAQGMPGPVSRGDVSSVRKHVDAIKCRAPEALGLYRELCERTVRLALAGERIDGGTASKFRQTLAGTEP